MKKRKKIKKYLTALTFFCLFCVRKINKGVKPMWRGYAGAMRQNLRITNR